MCDRYTLAATVELMNQVFNLHLTTTPSPLYNAGPTQKLPILKANTSGKMEMTHWGLIFNWSNNKAISPKLFNLSIESVVNKRIYQKGLKENRCIIPADGFYLWKQVGKKQTVPYYFHFAGNKPFGIAGLWEDYEDIEGQSAHAFIMLTTASTGTLATFQEEVPLILKKEAITHWLNMEADVMSLTDNMGQVSMDDLKSHPVSPLIGDLSHNHPDLIKPSVPSDQHGNYTLFN